MYRFIPCLFLGIFMLGLSACQQQDKTPGEAESKTKLEASEVKEVIKNYIQTGTNQDGYFVIEDSLENRTRQLSFGYVHSTVHERADERYFACVDFTEVPNDTLDLDFYVTVDAVGSPAVSEVIIHKVNGKNRLSRTDQ